MAEETAPNELGKNYEVGYCKPPVEHQFKKGHPPMGGRPKGKTLTEAINEALEKNLLGGKPIPRGMTGLDFLAEAMVTHAIKGKADYMKEIYQRREGKVPDKVQVEDMRKAYDVENPPDEL